MSEQLIAESGSDITKLADELRDMAASLERNGMDAFGGCFVVLPPKNGGDALKTLILDSKQDPAQFWSILQTKAKIALDGLAEQERMSRGYR